MIGATAKAEQFQTRSGSESTKGSRKGFTLLGGGINPALVLSEREARDSRQAALRAKIKVETQLHALAKRMMKESFGQGDVYFKWRAEVTRGGQAIKEIAIALNDIKKEYSATRPHSLEFHFMDACRESMPKLQFQRLLDEAVSRARVVKESGDQS